jgi:ADP-dependent phosphofructokinase/glucokinase
MAYQDKYLDYLQQVPRLIDRCLETGKRPVLGYTSNLDAVVTWDIDSFNEILKQYLRGEPSFTEGETIDSIEDFARIVCYYAMNGYGGEVEITREEVIEKLRDYFEIQAGLGGTCAQGAAALGAMEMPVLIHTTDRSKEVIQLMDYKGIDSIHHGKKSSIQKCVSEKPAVIHLVIQFSKGDIIKALGTQYEIPQSNRLIADYDQIHKYLPVDNEFLDYLEQHTLEMFSYSISGFNAIVDNCILEERIGLLEKHYKTVKENNPEIMIYFESAHYFNTVIRDSLYLRLSDTIDLIGMNEEELIEMTRKKARYTDKDNIESMIEGLNDLLDIYPVKGIVMHSKDYALFYGEHIEGIDLEMGLTLGNLMSGTRARTGKYGTLSACKKTLDTELSPTGMVFAERVSKMKLKHNIILVPSRYMEKPLYTIGLGDTFVAGMQMCFVR